MQPRKGEGGEIQGSRPGDGRVEPLPPLVSAALEPGKPTLAARLEHIATFGGGRPRHTVLGELARGGMGRILRAWDESLQREVAMKVVPRDVRPGSSEDERSDHERRLIRFVDEARITGQLGHPGIVPVYEVGLDASGNVYFTMPLVRGQNLKSTFERVRTGQDGWTLQRATDVMHKVCLTVAFAHSRGVVHRDLKPENVMVGPFGETYVMDWGLALLIGRSERDTIVGTPAYMSPEQAEGRHAQIGPRSDVYSLGAILYELLAGRMPHEASLEHRESRGESFEEVLSGPPRPLQELELDVPRELAAVCAKAMERDPEQRYASALEMADDLAAWLEGRVVSALDSGPWTRLVKWRARNRGLALALDALLALLVAGTGAFVLQQRTWVREVEAGREQAELSAYAAGLSAADLGLRAHEAGESKRRLAACDLELRGWEWDHLALRADASAAVLNGHRGGVRAVAVSPDGTRIASASDDGSVRLWDAREGTEIASLTGHAKVVTCVAFSPDGAQLASGSRDHAVRLWNVRTGALEGLYEDHGSDVTALAFSPEGRVIASGDDSGRVVLNAAVGGQILAEHVPARADGLTGLDFLAETGEIAAAYLSGFVRVLGAARLELRREARVGKGSAFGLDADPEGCRLVVALDRSALVLDAGGLVPIRILGEHGSRISDVAFSPDGTHVATSGYDNAMRVWDLGSQGLREFDGHDGDVNTVAFFPGGDELVTGAEDDSLRIWELGRGATAVLWEGGPWIDALAFSPDGSRLAAGAHDRRVRVFEVESGAVQRTWTTPDVVDSIAWRPERLVIAAGGAGPRTLEPGPASQELLPPGEGFPRTLCMDDGRMRLYSRNSRGTIDVYDLGHDTWLARLDPGGDEGASLALSPDGERLAAGTAAGVVYLWDARTLEPRASPSEVGAGVTSLAFSPDGASLAAGLQDRAIVLLDLRTGALRRRLEGHESLVSCLAYSPDGKRIASGSYDHTLRIWDPEDAESLLTLHGHGAPVTALAFDSVGQTLASGSKDGSVRLWRTLGAFPPARTGSGAR